MLYVRVCVFNAPLCHYKIKMGRAVFYRMKK